ncbi:hypothetical protein B0H19DRAFT_1248814 [Mycena capillaripes]|nr:hypothetical protein B0H19DRAFT_1248814 [Mycena capillaripes]
MNIDPSFQNTRSRDYLARLEQGYGLPAKQFLKESYDEYPLATTAMVIFAATSFTPVVVSAALAVFTVCLAISASLVALIGLALGLAVVLSTTLLSSILMTLLAAGALRLRNPRGLLRGVNISTPEEPSEANPTLPKSGVPLVVPEILSTTKDALKTLLCPLKGIRSWKARILAVILMCDAISRIRLPRVVRYNPIYRTLFGASLFGPHRSAHFLQRTLARPFTILRAVLWVVPTLCIYIAQMFLRFGWKLPLTVYLIVFFLSPRFRAATRRGLGRAAILISTAMGSAAMVVLRSEPVTRLRDMPWKAFTATAIVYGQFLHTVLTALVAFLRTQLEELEEKPAASVSGQLQQEDPDSDATFEMVAPVVDPVPVPEQSVEKSTLRARKISAAAPEEE